MMSWTEQPTTACAERYDLASTFDSLRTNPLIYPGKIPGHDFVFRQGSIWEISAQPGSRLTKAVVRWREDDGRARRTPLVNALLRWGATQITERVPVLAIGSNAYPRQLFDKFRDSFVDDTIPALFGTLTNIEVVFCPFVTSYGYVPVTPRYRPGARTRACLQLLSLGQVDALAKTEQAYRLVSLPADVAPFELADSREVLPSVYVFWHSEALRYFGELPPICAGTLASGVTDDLARRVLSHRDLCERLLDGGGGDPDGVFDAARRKQLAEAVLQRAGNNELPSGASIVDASSPRQQYGDARSWFAGIPASTGLRVRRTGPSRPREGDYEPLAYLHQADKDERNIGDHAVAYTHDASIPSNRPELLATVVRVVSSRTLGPDAVKRRRRGGAR